MKKEDPTIATLLMVQGYMTGQFGKNHLGDSLTPTHFQFDLSELGDDLLRLLRFSSWHLSPSLWLRPPRILAPEVASFKGGRSIESEKLVRDLVSDYWNPLWDFSRRVAVGV